MTNWLPDPAALRRPVYLALAGRIAQAIETGELGPGARLPTHRGLADALKISVQTVSRAYEELLRRGLIAGEVGRGTYVRGGRTEPRQPFITDGRGGEIIDLSILKPVSDEIHAERMRAALHDLADSLPPQALFSFRPNIVQQRHREIAVGWLGHWGIPVRPENVQLTNGATPGMTVALMTVARPGDVVATEAVGHHTLLPLAGYLGLRLKAVEVDGEGMVPDALDEACAGGQVRAVFVMPSATNPMVGIMSETRRCALAEVARRHDLYVIENDAWGPLVAGCPPPLAAVAPERTFHVSSFTKCVMPGLRAGYLVVPDLMIPAFVNRHLVTNWMATGLIAEIAARWVEDGTAWDLLLWQRAALEERHRAAAEILGDLPRREHPHSLHVWLPLPEGWREDQLITHARLQGVAIAPGSSFATGPEVETSAVRISVGPTSLERFRRGLQAVVHLARGVPEPSLLAI